MRKDVLAELGAALLTAKTSRVPRCAAQRLTSVQAAADAAYTALLRGTLETAGGTAAAPKASGAGGCIVGCRRAEPPGRRTHCQELFPVESASPWSIGRRGV